VSYAKAWTQAWCTLFAAGDGIAMLEWSPLTTVSGTALVSCSAAVGYLSLRATRDRQDPPLDWNHLVSRSLAAGGGLVAFSAVSAASPPIAMLVAIVALLTSPMVLRRVRPGSSSRADPSIATNRPHPPPGTERLVEQLEDGQLCRLWRWAFWELQQQSTAPEILDLVALRQACLDELERRNPSALYAWLASGARASGGPEKFWSDDPRHGPGHGSPSGNADAA
jgi:hypothetical protein